MFPYLCLRVFDMYMPMEGKEGVGSHRIQVTDVCELSNVGTVNWIQVF